jgi:hypothetical protein
MIIRIERPYSMQPKMQAEVSLNTGRYAVALSLSDDQQRWDIDFDASQARELSTALRHYAEELDRVQQVRR